MHLKNIITVVGAHAEGEVGRVITGGVLPPEGATMFERMETMQTQSDGIRKLLLFDPRGSVNAAVNLITPATRADADFGMIVMESDYYPPMSGSNLICTTTVALETGLIPVTGDTTCVRVDTPAGLVEVSADTRGGRCNRITFRNVESFVMHQNATVTVPGLGAIKVDVAYGGMIYVIVDAQALGLTLAREEAKKLVELGERIKLAAAEQLPSIHPANPSINTINQTLFAGPLRVENGQKRSKNAVVVSPGRIDRCPCGTGTSARLALLHARGEIAINETFFHESILDTVFESRVVKTTSSVGVAAIIPEVSGRAWLTGISHYGIDPQDPFPEGYRLNDTWFV